MSLAQETYAPPTAHTIGTPAMDLNNMLHSRQAYERYPPPAEGSQQPHQSPQIQLPAQSTTGEPQVVSTIHEGRLYRCAPLYKNREERRVGGFC